MLWIPFSAAENIGRCTTTVTYSFSFFLPIILKEKMKFSTAASQCLVAPPYVLAAILMVTTSWYGDKYRSRAPVLIFNSIVSIVGLCMMGFAKSSVVQYLGAFIGVAGCNANVPTTMVRGFSWPAS